MVAPSVKLLIWCLWNENASTPKVTSLEVTLYFNSSTHNKINMTLFLFSFKPYWKWPFQKHQYCLTGVFLTTNVVFIAYLHIKIDIITKLDKCGSIAVVKLPNNHRGIFMYLPEFGLIYWFPEVSRTTYDRNLYNQWNDHKLYYQRNDLWITSKYDCEIFLV